MARLRVPLLTGPLRLVDGAAALDARESAGLTSGVDGDCTAILGIDPRAVTGRRLSQAPLAVLTRRGARVMPVSLTPDSSIAARGVPRVWNGGRRFEVGIRGHSNVVQVLVTGATGFVGGALSAELVAAGYDVFAMTRRPDSYEGPGRAVFGDTDDQQSLSAALASCQVAYYLVHGLDGSGAVGDHDSRAARRFGAAAAEAGVARIVYLGGLGREGDDLSEHLASRQEVEGRLGQAGVPVTTLRAALVIGAGSASFELLRQVVAHLPVHLVPPDAATTKVQPIALKDVLRYLVQVLTRDDLANTVLEVGGPDVVSYERLLSVMASKLEKGGPRIALPVLPAAVARLGVRLVTDVDPNLAATLLDSLGNDVVVTDDKITRLLPGPLMTLDEMLDAALAAE